MQQHKSLIYTVAGTLLLVAGLSVALAMTRNSDQLGTASELETLATCLRDSGATFYGAFWCPHCQEQKGDFGSAVDLLPYVECATLDGNGQTEVCREAGVTSYPTWEFPGGQRVTGRVPLADLAAATGCPAPAAAQVPEDASVTPTEPVVE